MNEENKIRYLQCLQNKISFFKKQQWQISNFNLLLQVLIIIFYSLLKSSYGFSFIEVMSFLIISNIMAYISFIILVLLNESISKNRLCIKRIYNDNDLKYIKTHVLKKNTGFSQGNSLLSVILPIITLFSPLVMSYIVLKSGWCIL